MGGMGKIRALIDTNVLLDHLAKREEFYKDAAVVFSMANDGYITGIVSSLSIVNCAYVLSKHYDGRAVLEQIKEMLRIFTISNVDANTAQHPRSRREQGKLLLPRYLHLHCLL